MKEYSTPKAMKRISSLFDRYKNHFKPPQASVEKACKESIQKITNFDISLDKISYTISTRTIYLQVPSVLKTELSFKQSAIIKDLEENLGIDISPKKIL